MGLCLIEALILAWLPSILCSNSVAFLLFSLFACSFLFLFLFPTLPGNGFLINHPHVDPHLGLFLRNPVKVSWLAPEHPPWVTKDRSISAPVGKSPSLRRPKRLPATLALPLDSLNLPKTF